MAVLIRGEKFLEPGQCIQGNSTGPSSGLEVLPPSIFFSYAVADGFSFGPFNRPCELLFHANDTLRCRVPPGQGAIEPAARGHA